MTLIFSWHLTRVNTKKHQHGQKKSKEVQCKNTFTIYIVNVNKTENYLMSVSDTKSATSRTSTFTLTISLVNLKKKKFHKEH